MTRFRQNPCRFLVCSLAALASPILSLHADTAVFSVVMGDIYGSATGTLLPADSMLQLVDLGSDGVFNPIVEGSWVGGDDIVVALPFAPANRNRDGWLTAGSFDLSDGTGIAGRIDRVIEFTLGPAIQSGDKVGLRWFPGIVASNDYLENPPEAGTAYGEFTRQSSPRHGGTVWTVPIGGQTSAFDPLLTSGYAGYDSDQVASAGTAVMPVPEPAAAGMILFGAAALLSSRRVRRPSATEAS